MQRRVRFRTTPVQIAVQIGPVLLTWGLLVVIGVRHSLLGGQGVVLVAVGVGAAGLGAVALHWRGLELTAHEVVVRDDRVRRIPWAEVRSIRTRRRFGVRTLVIETERRKVRCPAPMAGVVAVDRHFDAKADYVQRWWQACVPPEAPGPRGDTGWGQPVLPGDLVG